MKIRRLAVLTVVGAVLTMGAAAANASAQATVCTNDVAHQDTGLCEGTHGKHLKIGSQISGSLESGTIAVLTVTNAAGGTVRVVSCEKATISEKLTTTSGGGNVEGRTFANCSSANCINVSMSAPRSGKSFPWPFTITHTSGTDGQMHITGPSIKFTATCFSITATCEYESSSVTKTVSGGTPAVMSESSSPYGSTAGVEAVCGVKADLSARYTVTTPSSMFIT
jgi:hypothetical protein